MKQVNISSGRSTTCQVLHWFGMTSIFLFFKLLFPVSIVVFGTSSLNFSFSSVIYCPPPPQMSSAFLSNHVTSCCHFLVTSPPLRPSCLPDSYRCWSPAWYQSCLIFYAQFGVFVGKLILSCTLQRHLCLRHPFWWLCIESVCCKSDVRQL